MVKKISLVGIQTEVNKDKSSALQAAMSLIDEAAALYEHIDVIVLPEYFYEITDKNQIGAYPETVKTALSSRARKYNTYIVGGTVLNRRNPGEKLWNTAVFFDREGKTVGSYDKIHLFDALNCSRDDQESRFCNHGDHIFTWDTDFGKIGIIVCYDIRFPELARTLALQGVRFLFVPSAFYNPRSDHWINLLKATAIQNSMYVLGVNLYGSLSSVQSFCGRSMLLDPWGVIVAGASDKADFFQAYIDAEYPEQISGAIGSFTNRVPSLYSI